MAVPAVAARPSLAFALVVWVAACIQAAPRVSDGMGAEVAPDADAVEETTVDTLPAEAEVSLECTVDGQCAAPTVACFEAVCRDNHCIEQPIALGGSCDDRDPCTGDGTCLDGQCQPGAVSPNGSDCDDGQRCNGLATCFDGVCSIPLPPTCPASDNPCAIGAECSEEAGGVCVDIPVEDGLDCDGPPEAVDPARWACSAGRCVPREMVAVPGGLFTMGCPPLYCADDNGPAHEVRLSPFAIDRAEVDEQTYRRCVEDDSLRGFSCPPPVEEALALPPIDAMPLRWVDFAAAETVCTYFGKRLCSEAEWEYAARGRSGAFYPWGNLPPTCERATFFDEGGPGCGTGQPSEVGTKLSGASALGPLDMAGNVGEWVTDFYRADVYERRAGSTPLDPVEAEANDGNSHVVRGGSFRDGIAPLRVFTRAERAAEVYQDDLGVRCCLSLTDP